MGRKKREGEGKIDSCAHPSTVVLPGIDILKTHLLSASL